MMEELKLVAGHKLVELCLCMCMMCICACMRTVFSAESENLASLKWQCLKTSEKLSFLYAKCKLLLECVHILWFLEG